MSKPTGSRTDPDFGQRLMAAFEAVADLPPALREARIEELCSGDAALETSLRALLARDSEPGALDADLGSSLQPLLQEALPALQGDPVRIGPYRVLQLLGEGGMGRVYRALREDSPVQREVAIKLIRPDRAAPGLLARFEAERRHLAALDHPGICRFIDADALEDGSPYVVMEAVQGEPLIDYCERRGLGLRPRLQLLRKLLDAVAHAHDRLLVHRDIKPQNVLVTAEGQPKLLDFGIAKSVEEQQASHTRTAERFFTPNASAPEQLLGQATGVAGDVYSLGALAYELLSGALPFDFEGLRAAEIERLILQVAPAPMSSRARQPWARELRGDLDAIVATCLLKDPKQRYANVAALDAELQRYLDGRPIHARAPGPLYRVRLFVRRHRTAVALSATLAVAITLLGSALLLQVRQASDTARLLQDMFLSSEAEGLSSFSMDLASFFARATDRAINDKTLSPAKRIELLQVLATRSTELNDLHSSERAARAALDTALARFGKGSSEYAHAADRVARTLLYGRGGPAVGEASELLRNSGEVHRRGLSSLGHMVIHYRAKAMLGQYSDDYDLMVESYRRIIELLESDQTTSPHLLLSSKSDFSNILSIAGDQSESVREADSALETAETLLAANPTAQNKDLWRVVAITACEQRARHASDTAVPLCERVLADLRDSNGLDSRAGSYAYFWLGNALAANGELDRALGAYQNALESLRNIEGENADNVDRQMIGRAIGRVLMRKSQHSESIPYHEAALAFFSARFSPTHPRVVPTRIDLLESLARSGQLLPEHPLLDQDFDLASLTPNDQKRWQDLKREFGIGNSK